MGIRISAVDCIGRRLNTLMWGYDMTSKQRAYLKSISSTYEPIFQIGKSSITPEICEAVSEALAARELIKLSVLKNCADDPKDVASVLAERT